MSQDKIDLIFQEWKASLKQRDRSSEYVQPNMEDLFSELKRADISFDEAHKLLPLAIKAHQPSDYIIKITYDRLKSMTHATLKEFGDDWKNDIADKGTNAFFAIYPRSKTDQDDDGEPKIYGKITSNGTGSMSAKEYKLQRRYAEQFPIIDTKSIARKINGEAYDPLKDLENILGSKKDGNSK